MTDFSIAVAAITAAALLAAGCSQAPEDDGSPEFAAMEYRHGLMHVQAFKVGVLRDMADGNIPADEDLFAEYAADLAAVAGMLLDGFEGLPGSDSESLAGSGALPAVWENWDDFVQKASDLEVAAEQVAAAAAAPGFAVGPDSAQPLGPTCGGCHRVYRQQ